MPLIPSKFKYTVSKETSFLFYQAVKELKKADTIIVGTDNDFEGGAIAFNIMWFGGVLKLHKKILRSFPTAMEKRAIIRQFKNLKLIDETWKQASAAISRSRSDWLIGMNLSRLYTNKLATENIYGNYAVGRLITATLNLICRWYDNINSFHEEPIYQMQGTIEIENEQIVLNSPVRIVGNGKNNPRLEYIQLLKKHGLTQKVLQAKVKEVESIIKESYPPILMTKGDLYKEMKKAHGWTQKRSEKVMQINY